jgi:hypothetical protein
MPQEHPHQARDLVIREILRALEQLRQSGFGSLEITVHGGQVTQIECREKVRFNPRAE